MSIFRGPFSILPTLLCGLFLAVAVIGCAQDMGDQPRYEPLEGADRKPVAGTVARGELQIDDHFFRGKNQNDEPVTTLPMSIDKKLLARGRQRYNIFCANCHDRVGYGQGMVVRRGFPRPPSLHIDRLQHAPVGYFFDTITNGFGRMPSLASQIPTKDRWAIIAYVRALQLSQHAKSESLTEDDLENLNNKNSNNGESP